ncbi:sigma-E processing peptidase SpoIIGA [Christensenellaceae bacterium OttesenSCG-928-M15]|nr:sigma-E processing peptidase SpoIIGA [Christensenellaceae bacterium OttesenSCG-928-M15]
MRVSIELFLLDNFIMNAAILCLASAICAVRTRLLWGALLCLFGAVYALLALSLWPVLLALPFRILMGLAISLGLRFHGAREYVRACACVFLSAMLLGGILYAMSLTDGHNRFGGYVNGVFVGTVRLRAVLLFIPVFALLPRTFRNLRAQARLRENLISVRVKIMGQPFRVTALIDTGNLLTEPMSGLPVMLMTHCPPIKNGMPVPYESIGAGGELMAARADMAQAFFDGRWHEMDIMVARPQAPILGADAIIGAMAVPATTAPPSKTHAV